MNHPLKIALLTMDNALSNHAVTGFINRNHEHINLVISSNPVRSNLITKLKQLFHHIHHSGLSFALFLTYIFFLFPFLLRLGSEILRFSDPRSTIKNLCRQYQIQYVSVDNVNDKQVSSLLEELKPDLIITCMFDQILGDEIINIPSRACLNLHPGILPDCRGVFPEFHTAAGKCDTFGVTIHQIEDRTIDTGRILLQKTINVDKSDSMLTTSRKLLEAGVTAMEEVLADLDIQLANATPQGEGHYYSLPKKEDIRNLKEAGFKIF